MASARGDSKPCTRAECGGIMQFGREPVPQARPAMSGDGDRGWVCSENPSHFRREAAAGSGPRARWADDGGSVPGKSITGSRPPTAQS